MKLPSAASQILLVLLAFSLFAVVRSSRVAAYDLEPSYYGCQILHQGQTEHLFARDHITNRVSDPVWNEVYRESKPVYDGPPYVQTPLWAWALQPVCTHLRFRPFVTLFLTLIVLSTSAILFLVAHFWAPTLFRPGIIAILCLCLYVTEPFQYALFLAQTHMIFIFLAVAAILLAQRKHPWLAGLLLAVAATVKITPGFLLIYWLCARKWRASISFVLSSVALVGVTFVAVSHSLFGTYLHELSQFSSSVMVAFNNQSFEAWWVGRHLPSSDYFDWTGHPASRGIRILSISLIMACNILGGWIDSRASPHPDHPRYGAVFAILGATVFASIAWSHYALVLLLPVMLLVDAYLRQKRRHAWYLLAAVSIWLLNVYPFSYRQILMHPFHLRDHVISILRSQFYATLLGMAALLLLSFRTNGSNHLSTHSQR